MNHLLIVIIIIASLSCCIHPESSKYKRNQGSSMSIQNSSNIVNNNQIELKTESTSTLNKNSLKMEIENGVRYVWIEINGIKLRFIFDTGASSICISPAEATVLYRQGTLRKEDILDIQYFQDATGQISEGTKINLREIKIGGYALENVEAIIIDKVDAPLLLGQSVLERFGSIEIDNINGEIYFN